MYCAAKWGVRGFTQGLREEAAAVGVRVTALLPGGVDTGFWKDAVSRNMPTEDFLTAEQVADAVVGAMATAPLARGVLQNARASTHDPEMGLDGTTLAFDWWG